MKVADITPIEGWLVVKLASEETKTSEGLAVTENDDDFVQHGEVLIGLHQGLTVIFHVLEAQTFFATDSTDSRQSYAFLKASSILGFYGGA